jgi:prophage regulatory protein
MCVLRMPQVVALTGLSRMTIYRLEKRRQFPSRIQLSPNSVGWRKEDVDHWLESLPTVDAPTDVFSTLGVVRPRSERPTGS